MGARWGDYNRQNVTLSAVNPISEHISLTRAKGVTTAIAAPLGGLITSQASVVNLTGHHLRGTCDRPGTHLGIDKDCGSLEAGRFANRMVTTGDPVDIRSQIEEVFVKGVRRKFDDRHTSRYEKFRSRPKP